MGVLVTSSSSRNSQRMLYVRTLFANSGDGCGGQNPCVGAYIHVYENINIDNFLYVMLSYE